MALAARPPAGHWDDLVVDRFAPILDRTPEGLALVEHGRVVYANPAFASLAGFACPEAALGKSPASIDPGFDCGQLGFDRESTHTCSGHPLCKFDRVGQEGTSVRVEATCTPFPWEGRSLLLFTLRDVTEQDRRRALYESELRLRTIFRAVAVGIVQCSAAGRIVESNPAIERMLGYSHEELNGMALSEFFPDARSDQIFRLFQQTESTRPETYQADLRYAGRADARGWVRFTASLVPAANGEVPFAIAIIEEITEYKRAERQLRDAQKMEAVGRLVGGVAHDFNNLLTGIMLYCDLLSAGLRANPRLREHAEEIRMAGEQGAALVQQLLAVARQQVVEPRILCINSKITDTRNLLARLIGENISLQMELDESLGKVRMDPTQLQQILLNLTLNARDAMPNGGRILVRTSNCDLQLPGATMPEGPVPGVMLMVIDDGAGMSAETRSHLFEPFFTTKSAGRGNGLGLVTVHDIVEAAGGVIEIESEPGRGTTFRVILPRVAEASEPKIPELQYSPRAARETILLLEDNLLVRQAVGGILRECGYRVLEAATGPEALALAGSHHGSIDLLLADLVLPGLSGRSAARRLRAARPEMRCLYISGYEPHTRARQDDQDRVVLFRKPFTGAVLLEKVREILGARPPALTVSRKRDTP